MSQLAAEGYHSIFERLIACLISIRTRDEATVPIVRRLFSRARDPKAIADMPIDELDTLIRPSTFYEAKARQISNIALPSCQIARLVLGWICASRWE
jgi:endonuclease-3